MLALVAIMFVSCAKTITVPDTNAVLTFKYGDIDVVVELTAEESETIRSIFNKERPHQDNPSCGFTENVSFALLAIIAQLLNIKVSIFRSPIMSGKQSFKYLKNTADFSLVNNKK